jgi:signal transduction histidine kinase
MLVCLIVLLTHNRQITSSESDSPHGNHVINESDVTPAIPQQPKKRKRLSTLAEAIQLLAPGAQSVAFLPLWDYDRSRWFAGCLAYTTSSDHPLSNEVDLVYLKAFGNSMMAELSRLDEIATNRMKNTFVASISHELRSPLHGILGGVEFMQDTSLDAFQTSMLHSIRTCGRTLLDTLDHILDHANLNVFDSSGRPAMATGHSMKTVKDVTSVSMLSKRPRTTRKRLAEMKSLVSNFDIALALEEVVESVYAGHSYRVLVRGAHNEDFVESLAETSFKSPEELSKRHPQKGRKDILLILDVPHRKSWHFKTLGGAWRRILMNIVGNAIKFTESGFVKISLRAEQPQHRTGAREAQVTLSVTDSGIGMSPSFLADRLYTPFSKENPFSEGTGLGLSLVRQTVESLGGRIDLKSQVNIGTEVRLKLMLAEADIGLSHDEDGDLLTSVAERMRGRRVCILQPTLPSDASSAKHSGTTQLVSSLANTLINWLDITVLTLEEWAYFDTDIVICTEPSFKHLASIRQKTGPGDRAPTTIFLAVDAIEAAALRNDARISSKESIVEILTQPQVTFPPPSNFLLIIA